MGVARDYGGQWDLAIPGFGSDLEGGRGGIFGNPRFLRNPSFADYSVSVTHLVCIPILWLMQGFWDG